MEGLIEYLWSADFGSGRERSQQEPLANRVDRGCKSPGPQVNFRERVRRENRLLGQARLRQAKFDVVLCFLGRKWIQMAAQNGVLLQPFQIQSVQRGKQLGAAG